MLEGAPALKRAQALIETSTAGQIVSTREYSLRHRAKCLRSELGRGPVTACPLTDSGYTIVQKNHGDRYLNFA